MGAGGLQGAHPGPAVAWVWGGWGPGSVEGATRFLDGGLSDGRHHYGDVKPEVTGKEGTHTPAEGQTLFLRSGFSLQMEGVAASLSLSLVPLLERRRGLICFMIWGRRNWGWPFSQVGAGCTGAFIVLRPLHPLSFPGAGHTWGGLWGSSSSCN